MFEGGRANTSSSARKQISALNGIARQSTIESTPSKSAQKNPFQENQEETDGTDPTVSPTNLGNPPKTNPLHYITAPCFALSGTTETKQDGGNRHVWPDSFPECHSGTQHRGSADGEHSGTSAEASADALVLALGTDHRGMVP
ncbi:hypothetical protein VDGL01_09782 [Verticillium dahliae]